MLTYGEGRSRATGLLPDLHIAMLTADRSLATLDEAIAQVYAGEVPRAMTLVTGRQRDLRHREDPRHRRPRPAQVAVVVIG